MAVERQIAALPPAQPSFILRGHSAPIHSVRFIHQNTRLLTGDAEGWVVYWKVETKRALAVWKAHDAAILGTSDWGLDKIITHGRDNSLRIWQVREADEANLSTTLPAEQTSAEQRKPWLLHAFPVNTLNFCAFSMCYEYLHMGMQSTPVPDLEKSPASHTSIFVAVPARDDKKVEVYQFPDEKLRFIVPRAQTTDTGMVMAVTIVHHSISNNVLVLIGYEGGLTATFRLPRNNESHALELAELVYLSQSHTQPILSLDASPDGQTYYTSSADAIVAVHHVPELPPNFNELDDKVASEPGEVPPSLVKLSPEKEALYNRLPTPSPDQSQSSPGQMAQESAESIPPLDFSKRKMPSSSIGPLPLSAASAPAAKGSALQSQHPPAGLSSLLASTPPHSKTRPAPPPPPLITPQAPHKLTDTKHAGQQSLHVRSDGRLLVTGGWDTRIRIYSTKTLKEVAVLKWHKEGVYAVDFSEILEAEDLGQVHTGHGDEVVKKETGLGRLQRQREQQMQRKHWVVAGAKDGKVSLWEVF